MTSGTMAGNGLIVVDFTDNEPTAEVTMPGVSGTSWQPNNQKVVFFEPDNPLAPLTEYTYYVTYCEGAARQRGSIVTTEHGLPLEDGQPVGRGFRVGLQTGQFLEPYGFDEFLSGFLGELAFKVTAADASVVRFLVASVDPDDDAQDLCQATSWHVAPLDGASFELGPVDFEWPVGAWANRAATIQDFVLDGTFAPDGAGMAANWHGNVDTRVFAVLIGDDEEDDAFCNLVAGVGIGCGECRDGAEYCLVMRGHLLESNLWTSATEAIEQDDCNENCAASWENELCDTRGW